MNASDNLDVKTKLEKTLSLNREMQQQLLVMKERLQKILSNVKVSYETNEVLRKETVLGPARNGIGIKGAYMKGGTFYLKGNMFFKDIKCRNCPNNKDYIRRKNQGEMFPMDLNLRSKHVWSTLDKQGIVLGIKEQILAHLNQSSRRNGRKSKEINSEKLAKLLNKIPKDFCIDWEEISSHNLQHRHSAKSCEAIWNLFLHPSLKRTNWTEKENEKLFEVAKKYNMQNWKEIAKEVGNRSEFQCFVQYQNNVCHMLPESYAKWSKEDDERLLEVIGRNTINGVINWSNVNAYFPHKAKTTLHSRYNFTLNPAIKHGAVFTPEEDLLLIAAVKEYGNKFSCIPRNLFPNRSLIQLRCHYKNVLSKRHKHQSWCLEDDIKLMDFVSQKGGKWTECEKFFHENHSRISCRTRYFTISRYLEKNPGATIEHLPRKNFKKTSTAVNISNWKEKVDELSQNSNGEKQISKDEQSPKAARKRKLKVKEEKPEKNKKRKKPATKETTQATKDSTLAMKGSKQEIKENGQLGNKAVETKLIKHPILQGILEKKKPRPYIHGLKSNGRNNYNFFKHAYDFEIDRHPWDNIQINNDDFAIVTSALNLQLTHFSGNDKFSKMLRQEIITGCLQSPDYGSLQLLPPNWSTAMGFRSMCINTASIANNLSSDHLMHYSNNDHIGRFRDRLRSIFYRTALLSRLAPGMVGITQVESIETTPPTRRTVESGTHFLIEDGEQRSINKTKCIDLVENIKTEFET